MKTQEMKDCSTECLECYRICLETFEHCLSRGGRHSAPAHVALLTDCAAACRSAADFLLRGSPRHYLTCRTCAEICRECAKDCRSFPDDREMERCALACERCAEACEKMTLAFAR